MIKAVIFDLDHTLFDRHSTLKSLVPRLREEFPVNERLSDEEIGDYWCYADDSFIYYGWEKILGHLHEKKVFTEEVCFEAYRAFLFKYFAITAVEFPETKPMLEKLREMGYKTGLITNGEHNLQYGKVKLLTLENYFDEIIVFRMLLIHPS